MVEVSAILLGAVAFVCLMAMVAFIGLAEEQRKAHHRQIEISEQIKRERDEARRAWCELKVEMMHYIICSPRDAQYYAEYKGWSYLYEMIEEE